MALAPWRLTTVSNDGKTAIFLLRNVSRTPLSLRLDETMLVTPQDTGWQDPPLKKAFILSTDKMWANPDEVITLTVELTRPRDGYPKSVNIWFAFPVADQPGKPLSSVPLLR